MKKIESLIEKAKDNKIALIVPEELIDTVEKYFDDDGLYDFTREEAKNCSFGIDFDNDEKVLDYGVYDFYVDQEYKLITLTKEDFKDITEDTNAAKSAVDNRTLLIVHKNTLAINDVTDDVYFNDDEAVQFLSTVITNVYTIIPTYGKSLERKPHISLY